MKSETSFRVFFLKQHRKNSLKNIFSHQKVYFWISAFDHRAIVVPKMHIVQCCPQKASAEFSTPSYISYRINLDMFRFEEGRRGRGGRKAKWSGHYEQRSVSAGCPQGSLGSPAARVTPRVQACHYCWREQNTGDRRSM